MKRKTKNTLAIVFVVLALIAFIACMLLVHYGIIEAYFPEDIMNTFNKISCVCLSLFIVLCVISVINLFLKKNKPRNGLGKFIYKITNWIDKHKISLVSALFAVTIISVNAHIALWVPAVISSVALTISSWE